jgi:hypothetical protein
MGVEPNKYFGKHSLGLTCLTVMPTRNARNGMLFTANGTINIKKKNGRMIFPSMKWQSLMWIQNMRIYVTVCG